jgi:hypothetical protein
MVPAQYAAMLLDLLIDASLPISDTRFARLLREIDRVLVVMAEIDAREVHDRQALAVVPPASRPNALLSMTRSADAITSAPAT